MQIKDEIEGKNMEINDDIFAQFNCAGWAAVVQIGAACFRLYPSSIKTYFKQIFFTSLSLIAVGLGREQKKVFQIPD